MFHISGLVFHPINITEHFYIYNNPNIVADVLMEVKLVGMQSLLILLYCMSINGSSMANLQIVHCK